jgi:hypothetical protein
MSNEPTRAPADYEADLFAHNPALDRERDHPVASRLARLYFMLDQLEGISITSKAIDLDLFTKLATLALRHEEALGISAKKAAPAGEEKPKPVRRPVASQ